MIAVFAYAFPHRKTQDFLVEIALAGFQDVHVIAAPRRELPSIDQNTYIASSLNRPAVFDTKYLAGILGFSYSELAHDKIDDIAQLQRDHNIALGLVSGARILRQQVIECFPDGIVNFHPGKLPETSGLDAFYYTLKTNAEAGVTTHLIDGRVDAGKLLFFEGTQIGADDSADIVGENIYQTQITSLRKFLSSWADKTLAPEPINRPQKNNPMSPDEKWRWLLQFPAWRASQFHKQSARKLFHLCEIGDTQAVESCLNLQPDLLEVKTSLGWTPLVIAAFHQHKAIVSDLLKRGADPNATGNKGTTVLMYAKTALMQNMSGDMSILDLLIKNGADKHKTDSFGKTVLDYVSKAEDENLIGYFNKKEKI